MSELHWLSARDLARAIAAKRVSPVEVVKAHLSRIEEIDPKLKSYLAVFADTALDGARAAETAVMSRAALGPLHGVPVAVKDLFDVRGTPTTAGSCFLSEPAAGDCTVVARLRAAGRPSWASSTCTSSPTAPRASIPITARPGTRGTASRIGCRAALRPAPAWRWRRD